MVVTCVVGPEAVGLSDARPGDAGVVCGEAEAEELARVTGYIGRDHPSVHPSEIFALLSVAYARTVDAPVQSFRMVLAEREVRRQLRAR